MRKMRAQDAPQKASRPFWGRIFGRGGGGWFKEAASTFRMFRRTWRGHVPEEEFPLVA